MCPRSSDRPIVPAFSRVLPLALLPVAGMAALTSGWAALVLLLVAAALWLWRDKLDGRQEDDATYFRALFEAAPAPMLVCAADGRVVSWNRAAAELLGGSPAQLDAMNFRGSALWTATPLGETAEDVLRSGGEGEAEAHGSAPWGRELKLRCRLARFEHGATRHLIVTMADISKEVAGRTQAEAQARAAQNLQGMSTLAGKMAHDFNNVLASISAYAAAAQQAELNAEARECLEHVMAASARGERVALQLSSLGVQQTTRRLPVELRRVVRDALDALRPTLRAGIEVNVLYPSEVLLVVGDPAELQQAVTILATRAARAMAPGPGVLSVELNRHRLQPGTPAPALPAGDYVRVHVTDGGPAPDAAASRSTAHPFSAGSAAGEGGDLELALVHTIVASHHGIVTGRGAPGHGTTFELYLPASEAVLPTLPADPAPKPKAPRGQGERVLVLDDDELIASTTARLLEHIGYATEAKHDAMEVAALIRENPARYDLVITDESMPELSGLDLAAQIREIRADLPILLMSGYGTELSPEKLQAAGVAEVMRKPARPDAIALSVHRLLHAATPV